MKLEGSCHCGKVRFSLESDEPIPYQRCYCSICRKTQGGGGYAINLGGKHETLVVHGQEHVHVYRAVLNDGERDPSEHERHFCVLCGSHLWAYNPNWPDLVHPVASAIDTELPAPAQLVHMMVGSRAGWVRFTPGPEDEVFDAYPEQSLRDWHREHGAPPKRN